MTETIVVDEKRCRFPGCPLPAAAPESGSGRPPEYCDDPAHNRAAAWRERKRLQRLVETRDPDATARPVQAAQQRAAEITTQLTQLADRFLDQLPKALDELRTLGDLTAAEAQIATVQSEAQEQIATASARAVRAEQARRTAEAERDEADAAAAEALEESERSAEILREALAATTAAEEARRAAQAALESAESDAAAAAKTASATIASLEKRLEEAATAHEGLAEKLEKLLAEHASAVQRRRSETARADHAEKAMARLQEQLIAEKKAAEKAAASAEATSAGLRTQRDTALEQIDTLRDRLADLRGSEAAAKADRDATRAELDRERAHASARLEDLKAAHQAQVAQLMEQIERRTGATDAPDEAS
ncbi:hypothetical protein [Nocardioides albus]|uniref:DNA repair exonuclease SbcCD ATPase subunit n=1 Tax=Nocardioides albus TaxID=1841 RepID=A0A7W5A7M6_9ACTN|nr:hypothetical protein [Nocardioides albus]MBB3091053.1 DNA repair exonuclease SbcCD ATPase subunit [Nocardioides albus]GGU34669.1 hypothetical protein GCM10007979_37320 [Nocardioides albus]